MNKVTFKEEIPKRKSLNEVIPGKVIRYENDGSLYMVTDYHTVLGVFVIDIELGCCALFEDTTKPIEIYDPEIVLSKG